MNLLDLTSNTIGINPDIADFLRKHLHKVFAIDGAIEILRAPIPPGWGPTSVQVELARDDEYPLDPQVIHLLMPYKDELAGSGWEIKHRIATLERISNEIHTLRVVFAPITYEEGTGFHRGLVEAAAQGDDIVLALRERLANQLMGLGKYSVAGVAVVHVVVVTSDDYLVLCQRSPHTGYHPLHWSISFEEQINQKDLASGNATLSAAAVRGFQEEFSSGHTIVPDNVRTLGVFLEYSILNTSFCVYIEAPLSFDELKLNWDSKAKDKWENATVVGEAFTLDNVTRLIQSNYYGETREKRGKFHPTSKYRLLLAAIYRFGSDEIIDALKSL